VTRGEKLRSNLSSAPRGRYIALSRCGISIALERAQRDGVTQPFPRLTSWSCMEPLECRFFPGCTLILGVSWKVAQLFKLWCDSLHRLKTCPTTTVTYLIPPKSICTLLSFRGSPVNYDTPKAFMHPLLRPHPDLPIKQTHGVRVTGSAGIWGGKRGSAFAYPVILPSVIVRGTWVA